MKMTRQANMHRRTRLGLFSASLLAVLFARGVCLAADSVAAEAFILKHLEDENFAQRQHATSELLRDETLTVAAIERLYGLSRSEEQRHRLLMVARHHMVRHILQSEFDNDGHGFIGITFEATTWADHSGQIRPAIAVTATIPGFPGHAHLRPGDVILDFESLDAAGADGPISVDAVFKGMIASKRAGQKIAMTVFRDRRRLEVEVELANAIAVVYDKTTGRLLPGIEKRWEQRKKLLQEAHPKAEPIAVDMRRARIGQRAGV